MIIYDIVTVVMIGVTAIDAGKDCLHKELSVPKRDEVRQVGVAAITTSSIVRDIEIIRQGKFKQ